jgi:post-segregation antitoxin (ccd killing protein)
MYMKKPHRNRVVTTITLDPKILRKARKYDLNISRICEDALKKAIWKMEAPRKGAISRLTGLLKRRTSTKA